jgi:transcriptional regulator with XRE-family HTH domain
MASLPPGAFATLLRRYRQAEGLTQEELAARARLSPQAIGALERGDRLAPRRDTVELLAEALSLTGAAREEFEAAARRRGPTDLVTRADESRAAASAAVPAGAVAGTRLGAAQPDEPWRDPQEGVASQAEHRPAPASGMRLPRRLVSVVMIALLGGSALLIRGETGALAGRLPLRCGGAIAIVTDLPTSGLDGANGGKATENAINLAVTQNPELGGGYRLKVINYDDVSPATGIRDMVIGARNVQQMVTNPCIVGVVGPLHSKLAPDEMVIAASAGLVMISPGVTNPAMTLRPYADAQGLDFDAFHPPGKPNMYFRVVPNDAAQGVADVTMTFNLGAKTVYTVTNTGPYGEELVGSFTPAFQIKGGVVAGVDWSGCDWIRYFGHS